MFLCFCAGLFIVLTTQNTPHVPQDPLIGKPLPSFTLAALYDDNSTLSPDELQGKVILINVFASWCISCVQEHKALKNIITKYALPIYGITWKDKPEDTRAWLEKHGNLYQKIGMDIDGRTAIDFGLRGAPETYAVSAEGIIIAVMRGPLTEALFEARMWPAIQYSRKQMQ